MRLLGAIPISNFSQAKGAHMVYRSFWHHWLLVSVVVAFSWVSAGWADLQVFPTRVYLSQQKKVANISLRHLGDKPGHYKLSTIFYRMNPNGTMDIVTDPKDDERPAVKYLRFSPRQITLNPRVEQVVRVLYAGPRNLPEGEYRAHLLFQPTDEDRDEPDPNAKPDKINMKLVARVAMAVPVVYRQGNPKFSVALSDLKLIQMADKKPGFSVELTSTGNAFPFGDFITFFKAPAQDKNVVGKESTLSQTNLGITRSVASYLPKRTVSYALDIPNGLKLSGGTLRVEFRQPEDQGGNLVQALETAIP